MSLTKAIISPDIPASIKFSLILVENITLVFLPIAAAKFSISFSANVSPFILAIDSLNFIIAGSSATCIVASNTKPPERRLAKACFLSPLTLLLLVVFGFLGFGIFNG